MSDLYSYEIPALKCKILNGPNKFNQVTVEFEDGSYGICDMSQISESNKEITKEQAWEMAFKIYSENNFDGDFAMNTVCNDFKVKG